MRASTMRIATGPCADALPPSIRPSAPPPLEGLQVSRRLGFPRAHFEIEGRPPRRSLALAALHNKVSLA